MKYITVIYESKPCNYWLTPSDTDTVLRFVLYFMPISRVR